MPTLVVNGAAFTVSGDELLLDVLRQQLGLKSASKSCSDGTCGACRVLVDGAATHSCTLHALSLREGAVVETYESLATDEAAVQAVEAFERERPTRCKLCVGALGVTAVSLTRIRSRGERTSIDEAIGEATCMCTGRGSWRRALSVLR